MEHRLSSLVTCLFALLSLALNGVSSAPPFDSGCLGLPCPRPPCDNPQMTTVIQNGKICPGCPVCPPENDCEDLPSCLATICVALNPFFCRPTFPTCGFENNQFCRGCDRCQNCGDIQCPEPKGRCRRFETLRLDTGDICNDCQICVDDFTPCPESICVAVKPNCPKNKLRFNPIHLNGRICLDCTTCDMHMQY